MRVISLGWGTQSFCLAAMSALGTLPHVDFAIHADTTHERAATYAFAARWTPWLENHDIPVITVKSTHAADPSRWKGVFVPAYTLHIKNGTKGQLHRECNERWKIRPIRRWLQAHRNREAVELWIGFTSDEARRASIADVAYITHRWPFLEPELWNGKRLSRQDTINWLGKHLGPAGIPPSSNCNFCPFHSRREWRQIRDEAGRDWEEAVKLDRIIRNRRPGYKTFLSNTREPLDETDLSIPEDYGQLQLWSRSGANA